VVYRGNDAGPYTRGMRVKNNIFHNGQSQSCVSRREIRDRRQSVPSPATHTLRKCILRQVSYFLIAQTVLDLHVGARHQTDLAICHHGLAGFESLVDDRLSPDGTA